MRVIITDILLNENDEVKDLLTLHSDSTMYETESYNNALAYYNEQVDYLTNLNNYNYYVMLIEIENSKYCKIVKDILKLDKIYNND